MGGCIDPKGTYFACLLTEWLGGSSFINKCKQHNQTAKFSDVCIVVNRYSPKMQKKYDHSCSRDGVRAGRGSLCAVLLPLSMATSVP